MRGIVVGEWMWGVPLRVALSARTFLFRSGTKKVTATIAHAGLGLRGAAPRAREAHLRCNAERRKKEGVCDFLRKKIG